jgi:hypothetical protein
MSQDSKYEVSFTKIEADLKSRPFYALVFNLIILSLFFIQALRAYLPGVYVAMFHVVFAENIIENLSILLTLVFFALPALTNTICKKVGITRLLIGSIYIIAISRLLIALHLPNIWQTILSGLIVAVYGMFLSTFITLWIKDTSVEIKAGSKIKLIAFCLLFAVLFDYLIRSIGISEDISLLPPGLSAEFWYITQYLWLLIQIPLTLICIYFTRRYFPRFEHITDAEEHDKREKKRSIYALIFVGLGAYWFLFFNIFLYPNIMARYTETGYNRSNALSILVLLVAIWIILRVRTPTILNVKISLILNGIMLVSLCLFVFLGIALNYIALFLMCASLIVIYLNFFILLNHMATIVFKWEKVKTISNAFAIGTAFYILFTVFHILSTDWAYVIPALRGFGPFIVIIAGVILTITVLISLKVSHKGGNKER